MNVQRRKQLVGKLVEAYVAWRESCARVNDTYRFWATETGRGGRVAFGLYVGALDAEEHAAEVYAGLARLAEKLSWREDHPAESVGEVSWGVGWP